MLNTQALVVLSGGEPLLQLDDAAIRALHEHGFEVGIETYGTLPAPAGADWICVSPKAGAAIIQTSGDELKLVFPQQEREAQPERFEGLDFEHFFFNRSMTSTETAISKQRSSIAWSIHNGNSGCKHTS